MADALHFNYGPGRFGRVAGTAGVVLQEMTQFTLASVLARKNQGGATAAAAERALGLAPPATPRITANAGLAFIWSGPGQWLALGAQSAMPVETRLGVVFGSHASIVDQSGSRVLLELRGARVRDVLAKGISIDLHPRAFTTGDVAVTTASHLAVHLWQVADDPVYRLLIVRTYFDSLWRWFAASAAEYGCDVLAPVPYDSQTS